MTVLSRRGACAVLALGAAAWLSTFVFDRVGTGAGTRVALVSSWQEWVGLTVLAFLVVLLGKAIVERGLEDAGGEKAIPGTLLLPMAALSVLALPYLPFVADAVPLDALAARTVVGVGHRRSADRLGDRHARDRRWTASRAVGDDQQALIVAAGVAIFGTAAWRLQLTPFFPRRRAAPSDRHAEPARRRPGVENNHVRGDYRAYFPAPLRLTIGDAAATARSTDPSGRRVCPHRAACDWLCAAIFPCAARRDRRGDRLAVGAGRDHVRRGCVV
jgi:hypothetical protein